MSLSADVDVEVNALNARTGTSRLRRLFAVCVICCVGMFMVTSLFASPAQRVAYRHGAVPASYAPGLPSSPTWGNGHVPTATGMVRGRRDHC